MGGGGRGGELQLGFQVSKLLLEEGFAAPRGDDLGGEFLLEGVVCGFESGNLLEEGVLGGEEVGEGGLSGVGGGGTFLVTIVVELGVALGLLWGG